MHRFIFAALFVLLALGAGGCDGPKPGCDRATCPGCCDSNDQCRSGADNFGCGVSGGKCEVCAQSQFCMVGLCINLTSTDAGENGGADGGGLCALTCAGCCTAAGSCVTPSDGVGACGTGGALCAVCTGNQLCASATCRDASCLGCVDAAGACQAGKVDDACGQVGVSCQSCQGGATCDATSGVCVGGSDGGSDGGSHGGSDGGSDAGFDAGVVTLSGYCPAYAQAVCAREARCSFIAGAQASACTAQYQAECFELIKRIDAGATTYDPAAGSLCVNDLATSRCIEGRFAVPKTCDPTIVFKPAASTGGPCSSSTDCVAGFCYSALARDCSRCRSFAVVGQACNSTDLLCDPKSSFCPVADGGARLCLAQRPDGQLCSGDVQCQSGNCNWNSVIAGAGPDTCGHLAVGQRCANGGDCVAGAYCNGLRADFFFITPGTCTTRTGVGQPCTNKPIDDGCVAGATCLGSSCTVVPPYSLPIGSECDRALGQCLDTLYCNGVAALQPDGGESLRAGTCSSQLPPGSACNRNSLVSTDCAPVATCGAAGVCVSLQTTGGPCATTYECKDFLACPVRDAGPRLCEPLRLPGQPCGDINMVCEQSAFCRRPDGGNYGLGTCATLFAIGTPCLRGTDCQSGRCFPAAGTVVATCQPPCF